MITSWGKVRTTTLQNMNQSSKSYQNFSSVGSDGKSESNSHFAPHNQGSLSDRFKILNEKFLKTDRTITPETSVNFSESPKNVDPEVDIDKIPNDDTTDDDNCDSPILYPRDMHVIDIPKSSDYQNGDKVLGRPGICDEAHDTCKDDPKSKEQHSFNCSTRTGESHGSDKNSSRVFCMSSRHINCPEAEPSPILNTISQPITALSPLARGQSVSNPRASDTEITRKSSSECSAESSHISSAPCNLQGEIDASNLSCELEYSLASSQFPSITDIQHSSEDSSSVLKASSTLSPANISSQALKKLSIFCHGQVSKSLLRCGFSVPELKSLCETLNKKGMSETNEKPKISSKEAMIRFIMDKLADCSPSAITPWTQQGGCAQPKSKKRKGSSGNSHVASNDLEKHVSNCSQKPIAKSFQRTSQANQSTAKVHDIVGSNLNQDIQKMGFSVQEGDGKHITREQKNAYQVSASSRTVLEDRTEILDSVIVNIDTPSDLSQVIQSIDSDERSSSSNSASAAFLMRKSLLIKIRDQIVLKPVQTLGDNIDFEHRGSATDKASTATDKVSTATDKGSTARDKESMKVESTSHATQIGSSDIVRTRKTYLRPILPICRACVWNRSGEVLVERNQLR